MWVLKGDLGAGFAAEDVHTVLGQAVVAMDKRLCNIIDVFLYACTITETIKLSMHTALILDKY